MQGLSFFAEIQKEIGGTAYLNMWIILNYCVIYLHLYPEMNGKSKIVGLKYNAGIFIGIVAALTILFSQSFCYSLDSVENAVHIEQQSDKGEGEHHDGDFLTAANDMVSSIAQLSLEKVATFIIEIPLNDEMDLSDLLEERIDFDEFFRTLFRQIISPNAP